jgi:hypothetical protein
MLLALHTITKKALILVFQTKHAVLERVSTPPPQGEELGGGLQ